MTKLWLNLLNVFGHDDLIQLHFRRKKATSCLQLHKQGFHWIKRTGKCFGHQSHSISFLTLFPSTLESGGNLKINTNLMEGNKTCPWLYKCIIYTYFSFIYTPKPTLMFKTWKILFIFLVTIIHLPKWTIPSKWNEVKSFLAPLVELDQYNDDGGVYITLYYKCTNVVGAHRGHHHPSKIFFIHTQSDVYSNSLNRIKSLCCASLVSPSTCNCTLYGIRITKDTAKDEDMMEI